MHQRVPVLIFSLSILAIFCASASCGDTSPETGGQYTALSVQYVYGSSANPNIYAIWIEDDSGAFIRPLSLCGRLFGIGGALTGADVLPYWHINKYPSMATSEVDAVTAATLQQRNFNVDFTMAPDDPRQFWVCFETDFSFDSNDWFNNQPAILYWTRVDLDSDATSWDLGFAGWTPHSDILSEARSATGNSSLQAGELVTETRFISNLKSGTGGFGGTDSRSATQVVASLKVVKVE